jgi:hypothetical protein
MSNVPHRSASIQTIIDRFISQGNFSVQVLDLDEESAGEFVRFRSNPSRFLPKIFDGDWADPEAHPRPGPIRIVRVLKGRDGVYRVIGRHDDGLYATPWI